MRPLFATLLLVAAGCHHKPQCEPGTKSKLELRDGSGATALSWKGDALCDAQMRRVASIETKGSTVTLTEPSGRLRLELTKESSSAAAGRDQDGPHLRLYRDGHELRVLRGDGVPLGSITPEGKRDAVIYNPGQQPLAKVSLRDRDAVVMDMSGSALTYVVPAKDAAVAGVFGIPHLDPIEQLAVYLYWSK